MHGTTGIKFRHVDKSETNEDINVSSDTCPTTEKAVGSFIAYYILRALRNLCRFMYYTANYWH
jgi:hypothetical protein